MIIYWGTIDMAHALGVGAGRTYNWYTRGLLPEPDAKTASGIALWREETAKAIVEERREWTERNVLRYQGKLTPKPGDATPKRTRRRVSKAEDHQLKIAINALERRQR